MRIRAIIPVVLLCTVFISGCGGDHDAVPPVPADDTEQETDNMPAGFQVINSSGVVQVDENYVNLALVAKGTVTIPANGIGGLLAPPQIQVAGISPILCLRPVSTYAFIRKVSKSGNIFSYVINGGFAGPMRASPMSETFGWYLFDRMSQVPASNYGIQVFNAAGELTFSSSSQPMRVVTATQIPAAPLLTTPTVVNAARYGVYAACMTQGRIAGGAVSYMPPVGMVFKEGIKINSSGAATAASADFTMGTMNVPVSDLGGQILLVDVEGL